MTENQASVGQQLIDVGWCQGSVFDAAEAPIPWLILADGEWSLTSRALKKDECFIVISQTCDLRADTSQEPFMSVMRCFWTDNAAIKRAATHGNSYRYFSLLEDGARLLIADAPRIALINKRTLDGVLPSAILDEDASTRFREWLAARVGRPALDDGIVAAVQRPIAQVIERMQSDPARSELINGLQEVRFSYVGGWPYRVDLLLLRDPDNEPLLSTTDAGAIAGEFIEEMQSTGGVEDVNWNVSQLNEVNAEHYLSMMRLPLDHYSLPAIESVHAPELAGQEPNTVTPIP